MNDLTMNDLVYDLTNDVIIDKTGRGVTDIRNRTLRITLGPGESFADWAAENFTPGNKELRFVKFLLRAEATGEPLNVDDTECACIVESLRSALRTNADALRAFWFGYTLKAQMKDAKGVAALKAWVDKNGGPTWWEVQWEPIVRSCAASGALAGGPSGVEGRGYLASKAMQRGRRMRCLQSLLHWVRKSGARTHPA